MINHKDTINALHKLKQNFNKLMTLTQWSLNEPGKVVDSASYNDIILNKARIKNIITRRGHIFDYDGLDYDGLDYELLNLDNDINKIHLFVSENFLEHETYKIKVPINLLKLYLDNCTIVIIKNKQEILSLIAYKPDKINILTKNNTFCNIKILCTHKRYRHNNYAKTLLAYTQEKCLSDNIISSIFMSNIGFMKPTCKLQYYYRPINPELLLLYGFSGFKEADFKINEKDVIEYYKIDNIFTVNIQRYNKNIHNQNILYNLYETNIDKYSFSIIYNKDDFNKILDSDSIITYIILDINNNIIDFVNYYKVYHETVINKQCKDICVGNLFMYTTININIYKLLKNLLIMLVKDNVDLLTVLDNMENDSIIEIFKFIDSQSYNHIYLYNWNINEIHKNQINNIFYL